MRRLEALASAADLFRRFHPWSDEADRCDALENRRALKSPKALERSHACQIGVRISTPFGDTHRIEACGETWEEVIAELRRKLRADRIAFGGATPWLHALMDAAADGTLDAEAARQFRAWVDHDDA